MGILNELKQQADELRSAEAEQAARLKQQEAYYHSQLRPAMGRALTYLDELIKHINLVQPERTVEYPLAPNRQQLISLRQSLYRLVIDSSDTPRQVDIRVTANFDPQPVFELSSPKSIVHYAEHLDKYGLRYHRQDMLNNQHQVERCSFTLEGPLQLAVRLQTDAENQCIHITLKNFGQAGIKRHQFRPEKIDDALLDRLGRLLLHDVDSLTVPQQMPDEVRERIRKQLATEKQREADELAQAEAEAQREREAAEAAKFNNRLKNSLTKKAQKFRALYRKP